MYISRILIDILFSIDQMGNHDSFGVPASGGDYDFYQKDSINANLRRSGRVQRITLEISLSLHV
jgi:hypothetical protein